MKHLILYRLIQARRQSVLDADVDVVPNCLFMTSHADLVYCTVLGIVNCISDEKSEGDEEHFCDMS